MSIALRQPCPKCGAVTLESYVAGEMYTGSLPVAICNNSACGATFLSTELTAILARELESRTLATKTYNQLRDESIYGADGVDTPATELLRKEKEQAKKRIASWPEDNYEIVIYDLDGSKTFKVVEERDGVYHHTLHDEDALIRRIIQLKGDLDSICTALGLSIYRDSQDVVKTTVLPKIHNLICAKDWSARSEKSERRRGDLLAASNRKLGEELEAARNSLSVSRMAAQSRVEGVTDSANAKIFDLEELANTRRDLNDWKEIAGDRYKRLEDLKKERKQELKDAFDHGLGEGAAQGCIVAAEYIQTQRQQAWKQGADSAFGSHQSAMKQAEKDKEEAVVNARAEGFKAGAAWYQEACKDAHTAARAEAEVREECAQVLDKKAVEWESVTGPAGRYERAVGRHYRNAARLVRGGKSS